MNELPLEKYLGFAIETAEKAANRLYDEFAQGDTIARGTSKEVRSFFDTVSDTIIKEEIEREYPTHSYLTEETGMVHKEEHNYLWIVDPLDGTGNFVNANPLFAVSIALWIDGEPQVGVIHAPALNERYVAIKDGGAFVLNTRTKVEKNATVSSVSELSSAYTVYCEGGSTDKEAQLRFYNQLFPLVKDMRKMGSAALELAWVGVGRSDMYVTPEINIWDIAAGVLFVQEAGGEINDFGTNPYDFPNMLEMKKINVVASNGRLKIPPIKY